MPFQGGGKLNLPRLKIQSWRFEKKKGGRGQRGSEKTSAWFSGVTARETELGSLGKRRDPAGVLKAGREREREVNREARAGSRQMR